MRFGYRGANRTLEYAVVGMSSSERTAMPLPQIVALIMVANIRVHIASYHFPVHFGCF